MSRAYSNFINTLDSPATRKIYAYCLEQFLTCSQKNLENFLKLPAEQQTDLITQYLVQRHVSRQFKNVIFATIRHALEVNDSLLNWRKIKKFIRSSQKSGNEIAGRDRGYTHEEIQKILEFSDQQIKTCFLILASTGIRIGALPSLKVGDLKRVQDLYKLNIYSDDQDDKYVTFCTPEAAKEIDAYLEFRKRRQEHITSDSYLIVKKFSSGGKSEPYTGYSLRSILQFNIDNTGLREKSHNRSKRKEVPLSHGFRKFFTKQLVDSKVDAAKMELLHGHDIGLTGKYYRPTEQDMLNEYLKAIPLLTISNEERLKFKLEERITIEKTQVQAMREDMEKFKKEIAAMKRKRK